MSKGFIFSGSFKGLVAMRLFHGAAMRVKMKLSRPKAKEITCKNGENKEKLHDSHVFGFTHTHTHTPFFAIVYGVGVFLTFFYSVFFKVNW